MDETRGRSYHAWLIGMTSLKRFSPQALCIASLLIAACSGDDNAAPPGTGGSAGSGGSAAGSAGTAGGSSTGDSSLDVSTAQDSASDAASEMSDAGSMNCPSLPDGGTAMAMDGGEGGADATPANFTFPPTLVETGLYCDFANNVISPSNKKFRPKYELWSDGAVKTRWFYLPPNSKVDTMDMDHWQMPVGARFWKEFKYNGKRIETRLIVRTGPGANDFNYAAYKWSADEKTATLWNAGTGEKDYAPIGPGAEGILHDIPSEAECGRCHGPLPEHILGFSAIQLSHNLAGEGENITTLSAAKLLSATPDAGGFTVPGNAVEEAALGFLHANCGNCHNETSTGVTANITVPYIVRVLVGNTTVASTKTYQTAVNVAHSPGLPLPGDAGIGNYRIQGGSPDASELHYRMSVRGTGAQMPPIDTKLTTPDGLTIIENWIKALPPPPDAGDGG